jgi:hypothetical protein
LGAGFLGGIVAGFIAGYGVDALNRAIRLPKNLQGLKPVLILPLLGTLLTGLLMIYAVGTPVAAPGLSHRMAARDAGSNAVLLGLILGAMMAFDGRPGQQGGLCLLGRAGRAGLYADGGDHGGGHDAAARHRACDAAVPNPSPPTSARRGRAPSRAGLHQRGRDPFAAIRSG